MIFEPSKAELWGETLLTRALVDGLECQLSKWRTFIYSLMVRKYRPWLVTEG